ncbi:hypothetical protein NUKP38_51460 [Klebsiella variicola]|nr:hypothetical protein NUKP38_51460 [Klebsiella variicola]
MCTISNVLCTVANLHCMGIGLKSSCQFSLISQAYQNAFNRINVREDADCLRITTDVTYDSGWPQLKNNLMVRDITRNRAVVVTLGQKPFYIGTGTVRVQNCQDMNVTGCRQFHSWEKRQRSKVRNVTGTCVLIHPHQFIFQRINPGPTVMIANDNTIYLLSHVGKKPFPGRNARNSVIM